MNNKRSVLEEVKADAARLTRKRLEEDGFVSNYPNGYSNGDLEEAEVVDPMAKAREAKAAKASAKADKTAGKDEAKAEETSTNEEGTN